MIIGKFKRNIINAFDKWAVSYNQEVLPKLHRRGYSYQSLAETILDFLMPPQNSRLAEFGIGTGVLGIEIKKLRPDLEIIGFDISSKMIEQAKLTGAYYQTYQCDSEIIPIKDNEFHCVYSAFMFHSVLHPKICLSELKRVVAENGKIALVDLFRSKTRVPFLSKLRDNLHSFKYEYGALSCYLSVDEVIALVTSMSMQVLRTERLDKSIEIEKLAVGGMAHHFLGIGI